jgi:hypothetical protein
MRHLVLSLALAAIAAGTARAEQARLDEPGPGQPIAVAVNVLPVDWDIMMATTAWIGLDAHQAIRANVARYRGALLGRILGAFSGDSEGPEEGDLPPDFGATTDISLGWSYYPRRVLDGASLETELLTRFDRRRDRINGQNMASEEHHTNVYGGRVFAGWTWRLSDWWFVATAFGGTFGYERGREKTFVGYSSTGELTRSGPVSRAYASLEGYLRIGLAFGQ